MKKAQKAILEKAIRGYFKEIHNIYTSNAYREESFYPSLKKLFEESSKLFTMSKGAYVLVLPKKTDAGIPDFRISKNGEIIVKLIQIMASLFLSYHSRFIRPISICRS